MGGCYFICCGLPTLIVWSSRFGIIVRALIGLALAFGFAFGFIFIADLIGGPRLVIARDPHDPFQTLKLSQ